MSDKTDIPDNVVELKPPKTEMSTETSSNKLKELESLVEKLSKDLKAQYGANIRLRTELIKTKKMQFRLSEANIKLNEQLLEVDQEALNGDIQANLDWLSKEGYVKTVDATKKEGK